MTRSNRICISSWLACVVAIALLAISSRTSAQDAPPMPGPTKEHELLKNGVGTWDATIKMSPQPGAEPMVSKGVEKNELIGGMWLVSRFEGEMMGMPFSGAGTFGYDPVEKKYVGTWVDSMSPHMLTIKGDYDSATKTMTEMAEGRDPMTGQITTSKLISRQVDDDTRTFEFYAPGADGQFQKMMEIEYKRRAE
jgi:hypothetical protein